MATLHRWGYAQVALFLVGGIRTLEFSPFLKVKRPSKDSLFGTGLPNLFFIPSIRVSLTSPLLE